MVQRNRVILLISGAVLIYYLADWSSINGGSWGATQVWQAEVLWDLTNTNDAKNAESPITLAVVCCGNKTDDLRTLLKSAMVFGQDTTVEVKILSDFVCASKLQPLFKELTEGVRKLGSSFTWTVLPAEAPVDVKSWDVDPRWRCGFIRLFLPDILTDVDAVYYLDLDIIILSNLTKLWEDFAEDQRQHPTSVVAVMDHVPRPARYYYSVEKRVPFFGHGGVNSGNIFMNLTRMRALGFSSLAVDVHKRYGEKHTNASQNALFLDQDLLNVLLSEHPDSASLFDCTFNFNPSNCGTNGACWLHSKEDGPLCFCWRAFETGIKAVHGFGHTFHNLQVPIFRDLYEGFWNMKLDPAHPMHVISVLRDNVSKLSGSCFYLTGDALYSNALSYLQELWSRKRI